MGHHLRHSFVQCFQLAQPRVVLTLVPLHRLHSLLSSASGRSIAQSCCSDLRPMTLHLNSYSNSTHSDRQPRRGRHGHHAILQAQTGGAAAVQSLPLTMTGQVMSAGSNLVRVEVDGQTSADTHPDEPSTSASPAPTPQHASLPRRQFLCNLRSLIKKLNKNVLVGDRVVISSIDWAQGRATVEDVLERTSELTDPAIANVDHALLVFALDNPPFEEVQVSRFLVSMEAAGLPFSLLLNKTDLVPQHVVEARVKQVRRWGYEPILVSCQSGLGLQECLEVLRGKTCVVAGPSGAGKSSLINALRLGRHRPDEPEGEDSSSPVQLPPIRLQQLVQTSGSSISEPASSSGEDAPSFLAVGELSRMGRGMHTTTSVTLIKLPGGGRLADTPGFSQPSLDGVSSSDLAAHFPEFQAVLAAAPCRFNNCLHVAEPGCSIAEAAAVEGDEGEEGGGLERYPLYLKALMEIKAREETDVKVMQMGKRQREGAVKVKSGKGGQRRVEAKLDRVKRQGSRQLSRKGLLDALDE